MTLRDHEETSLAQWAVFVRGVASNTPESPATLLKAQIRLARKAGLLVPRTMQLVKPQAIDDSPRAENVTRAQATRQEYRQPCTRAESVPQERCR
ncbi:hypothetical protein ACFL6M_03715 [Candidatus Eisenbacteria bacterium]|uniref:Uncharacterized protein n=1 Tax=Eiseniibacteriota bacterium TaxID=2212470 RepID=A0ABV6YK32_UNCEI